MSIDQVNSVFFLLNPTFKHIKCIKNRWFVTIFLFYILTNFLSDLGFGVWTRIVVRRRSIRRTRKSWDEFTSYQKCRSATIDKTTGSKSLDVEIDFHTIRHFYLEMFQTFLRFPDFDQTILNVWSVNTDKITGLEYFSRRIDFCSFFLGIFTH